MKNDKKLAAFETALVQVCEKLGRKRAEINLVAITKKRSPAEINNLLQNGIKTIGENRLQEFLGKKAELRNCKKHFVGRIQANKAQAIAQNFDLVESVSSLKIAQILNSETQKLGKKLPIFLQANLAREPQKDGFLEENLEASFAQIGKLENLKIEGLMVIGVLGNWEKTRAIFEKGKSLARKFGLARFSAGMSDDWEIGIKAGATEIRIGRKLFEN